MNTPHRHDLTAGSKSGKPDSESRGEPDQIKEEKMFLSKEKGQGLVEYVLILILVAIVVIVILFLLGPGIGRVISNIFSAIGG